MPNAYLLFTETLDAFRVCVHGDAAALQMDTIVRVFGLSL